MEVNEIRRDTVETYVSQVFWGMDETEQFCLLIDRTQKMLCFNKLKSRDLQKSSKIVKQRIEYFKATKEKLPNYVRINDVFIDNNKGIYHISLYWNEGVMFWITRIDKSLPCYFFMMIPTKSE